jgi:uncharacterized protein YbaA (DUF1428 family)
MSYIEGFVLAVPTANKQAFRDHAGKVAEIAREFGVERQVEAWGDDVQHGKVTDFYRAVDAKEDETIVFAWFEYPSKAARDSANEKFRSDPRTMNLGEVPFDGKRMIMGGFEAIVDEGSGRGGFVDGWVVPVPEAKRDAYRELAARNAKYFVEYGALRVVEAIADDVSKGEVTDFYRAIKAEDGETMVFSFIEWPDRQSRDEAWKKVMADERMQPGGEMPFDGKRMFWGGFEPVLDTATPATKAKEAANA